MVYKYIQEIKKLIGDKGEIVGSATWCDYAKDIDVVVPDNDTAWKLAPLGLMWEAGPEYANITKHGRTVKNKNRFCISIANGFGIDVFVGTKQ